MNELEKKFKEFEILIKPEDDGQELKRLGDIHKLENASENAQDPDFARTLQIHANAISRGLDRSILN